MVLKYQNKLDSLGNCPVENLKGEITLFRCVENPVTPKSFIPNAILKPKFKDDCKAWGLSLFKSYDSAQQMLNGLSKNKKVKYSTIAKGIIKDEDGVKHGCHYNKIHYTFYPIESLDIVGKFVIVDTNENK